MLLMVPGIPCRVHLSRWMPPGLQFPQVKGQGSQGPRAKGHGHKGQGPRPQGPKGPRTTLVFGVFGTLHWESSKNKVSADGNEFLNLHVLHSHLPTLWNGN